jgi:hypothetical protein
VAVNAALMEPTGVTKLRQKLEPLAHTADGAGRVAGTMFSLILALIPSMVMATELANCLQRSATLFQNVTAIHFIAYPMSSER